MTGFRSPISLSCLMAWFLRIMALILARNSLTFFFDGLISSVPLYFLTLKPRKSNPSSIWVIFVFSSDRVSPRAWRNSLTAGLICDSKISLSEQVIIKSSAYRTRFTIGLKYPILVRLSLKFSASIACRPSSAIFASVGDMIPPCGAPSSVGNSCRLNTNPLSSHLQSMTLSVGILSSSHWWLIWSKQPLMSPSSIHCGDTSFESIVWHCTIASTVHLSLRKP